MLREYLFFVAFLLTECQLGLSLKPEVKAQPVVIDSLDVAAMDCHGVFHDGEPQSGAARLTRPPLVDTVKAFEYVPEMRLRNTRAIILNHKISVTVSPHFNFSAAAIGYGIADKIPENGFK